MLVISVLMHYGQIVSLTTFLIHILIILDFILIGGVLPYLERKKLSLIQKRVGPKFVGLNGRIQFIADALKIFFKDYYNIVHVKKYYFFLVPILFLFYNLLFILNFQWGGYFFFYDVEINIIYILSFSVISGFLTFLTGYFCKNKYTIITSARTVSVMFINELLFSLIVCQIFYISKNFSFTSYTTNTQAMWAVALWIFQLPVVILVFLLEVNKVPFDFQEAESELIMGFTNEYTGFLFGVYVLIEYLHIFIYCFLLTILFF